jgi:integrase
VQARLGHSTLAMTMDIYGHLLKGDDAEEMDKAVDEFMAVG